MPRRPSPHPTENLCAMMAWCFHAPGADLDIDGELRMTRDEQRRHQAGFSLPRFINNWLPSNPAKKNEEEARLMTTYTYGACTEPSGSVGTPTTDGTLSEDANMPNMLPPRTNIVPMNALPPRWVHDESVLHCEDCDITFDLLVRKHHCRACGRVLCANCTSETERVVKYGFTDPVRVCQQCAMDARAENELYEVHLPVLELGDVFLKRGLLRRRLVELKFLRSTLIFQYQTIDPELRVATGELKAFPLDAIIDVRTTEVPSLGGQQAASFVVVVGNEEHRFDAASFQLRREWITAIQNLRDVRNSLRTREQERLMQQREVENDEMRQIALSLQKSEERKASFYQERLRKRAEQRETLRAKYHLGSPTAAS